MYAELTGNREKYRIKSRYDNILTWANQIRMLTQNFQQLGKVIGGTLINAFKPLVITLNNVMSAVISFAETIANALGAIFGWTIDMGSGGIVNDLEDGFEGVEDAAGGAADNVKKMGDNLQAFDKLNVIKSADPDSGGGGGAAGAGTADGAQAQFVRTESMLDKYESEIDRLFKLGEYIGQTLTNAMNSISWDSVYEGARNFGTGLADFLNGLISPELFGALGKTIASCMNTAIHSVNSFGKEFEWDEFGDSIAAGINEYFSTYDFYLLADTLNTWVDGLEEMIGHALKGIKWSDIIESAGELLGNLELDTVAVIIGGWAIKKGAVGKFVDACIKLFSGGITLENMAMGLKGLSLSLIGSPAFDVIGGEIVVGISEWIEEHFGESVSNAIGEALLVLLSTGFGFVVGGPIGAAIGAGIGIGLDTFVVKGEWITKFWNTIQEKLFNFDYAGSLLEKAKGFFNEAFNADNFLEFGANIIAGIAAGLTAGIAAIGEPFVDLFNWVVDGICGIFGINSPAEEMKPYGKYILEGIIEGFRNTFEEWTSALTEWYDNHIAPWFTQQKWSELYNTIKTELKTKWDEASGQWKTDISTWWNSNVTPWFTVQRWQGVYGAIKSALKTKWDEAKAQWKTNIQNWWSNDVTPWFTGDRWTSALSGIKTGFENAFNAAVAAVKTIWNRFAGWLNDKLTFDIDPISVMGIELYEGGTFNIGHIPTFATGGFIPEDGLFMANHNEIVGQFSNGRGVVANNEQITDGIAIAVQNANSEQNNYLREMVGLLEVIKDRCGITENDVYEATQRVQHRRYKATYKTGWAGID